MVLTGGWGSNYYNTVYQRYATITSSQTLSGDTNKSGVDAWKAYNGTTIYSGTFIITHNNDGTASFTASAGGSLDHWTASYNTTGSRTWDLKRIPKNPWTVNSCTITNSQVVGEIVAGHSVSTFNVSASAGTSPSAPSIAKYRLYDNSNKLLKESNSNNFTYTVQPIDTTTKSIVYKVSVVDSWNQESALFTCSSFTAKKYVQGQFTTDPETRRYDTTEQQVDESIGQSALCEISFSQSTIGGSPITTTVRAEVNGDYDTTTSSPTALIVGNDTLSGTSSYNVLYTLYDGVTSFANSTVQATDIISVSFHTIHLHKDGHGIGFGVESSDGYVDVDNMEFRLNDGVSYGQMSAGFITNNHQDHGLYSYGYVDSNNQFHSDPMWLIKRDNTGAVSLGGASGIYTDKVTRKTGVVNDHGRINSQGLAVWGKIATLSLSIVGDGNVGPYERYFYGEIADGFRPAIDIAYATEWYDNTVLVYIHPNGIIDCYQPYNANKGFTNSELVVAFTYILA